MAAQHKRTRVLLSEGSSNSARQALYGLGRKYTIDLVDPSPWCQCRFSSLVRKRIACPQVAKDPLAYLKFVASLVDRRDFDVLFPTHEQVYAFSRFRDRFRRSVALAVPDFEVLRRVQSKAEFVQVMKSLDLPLPESWIVRDRNELAKHDDFPCFVKLAHSTASLGVQRVDSPDDLTASINRFEQSGAWREGDEIVLQTIAPGRQAEVSAVFQEGRLVGAACADVLATGIGGGPALRRTAIHPPVLQHIRKFGEELGWHGPVSMEYFYDETTERPYYIESNPRIGESFNALAGGVNLCEATVRIALGEQVDMLPPVKPGVMTHNGFIVMIADAFNGANRRQLWRRLWKHWTRSDGVESEMTRPRVDLLSLIPATAVILRLLVAPRSAQELAKGTVDNYSLPARAAQIVDDLPADAV